MARVPDGARFSVCGERVARLARPSPGRRPGIQPQVGEDLLDRCPLQDGRDDLETPAPQFMRCCTSLPTTRLSKQANISA
jgi:hypothetical protein